MPQALLQWRSPLKAMAMPAGSDGNARWKRWQCPLEAIGSPRSKRSHRSELGFSGTTN
ncbi:MAG: hypothetical protein AAFR25_09045 [Cyanobacteria bacterium J06629_19]